ncbi:MAG TPA: amidohydrolase family protein [Chloroflexota bacterium]|nr:amidohydrolase family protein [Chloroflexota bacterium]
MEIVDSQLHMNLLAAPGTPDDQVIDQTLAAMVAVGVDKLLIVEATTAVPRPEEVLPNGTVRRDFRLSKRTVERFPETFRWVGRVDYDDADVQGQVARLKHEGAVALRVVPLPDSPAVAAFEQGAFEALFAAAQQHALPVFTWLPGRTHLLPRYLRQFPDLTFILDHAGTFFEPLPEPPARYGELAAVCELAAFPNLAVKWCHGPERVSVEACPYRDLQPYLRRMLDAFTPQRVMWASDYIPKRYPVSWAQSLYHVLTWNELSDAAAEWFFGRTLRTLLPWS